MLEETTVAGICCFFVSALEVGVVAFTSVSGTGMTVTVEAEVTGGLEDDATVTSMRELEVAISTVVGVEAASVEDVSLVGAAEKVEEGTMTPVRTVEVELWLEAGSALEAGNTRLDVGNKRLDVGNTRLDVGTSTAVLPCPGVMVTVTIGFVVTVTTPESHGSEPAASMLESPGLPTLTPTSAEVVGTALEPPTPPKSDDSGTKAEEMVLTVVTKPVLPRPIVVLPNPYGALEVAEGTGAPLEPPDRG